MTPVIHAAREFGRAADRESVLAAFQELIRHINNLVDMRLSRIDKEGRYATDDFHDTEGRPTALWDPKAREVIEAEDITHS